MHIFILTLGTRGDVQPYVALGRGLIKAGHQVTICTSSSFEGFITENELQYGYMNNEIIKLIDSDAGRDAVESSGGFLGWIKTMIVLTKQVKPLQQMMIADAWESAVKARPDLIIYHRQGDGRTTYGREDGHSTYYERSAADLHTYGRISFDGLS